MLRFLLMILLFARRGTSSRIIEQKRVRELVRAWAPLVWLAPGERYLPLGVSEFLDNVKAGDDFLYTRVDIESLLRNESSFLYGKEPAENVPIYALLKDCSMSDVSSEKTQSSLPSSSSSSSSSGSSAFGATNEVVDTYRIRRKRVTKLKRTDRKRFNGERDKTSRNDDLIHALQTNDLPGNEVVTRHDTIRDGNPIPESENRFRKLHFHVTYWMFYPFSEGKAVCVLDLGFFGSWPIPSVGGVCLGKLKEYGNHVGDWEHMSLYFKGEDHPVAMYVSAHDAGAFYRYDSRTDTFLYESQETRKGIFQKPIFPERVFTSTGSHPVLFSARGSHGLWTAPGKHKFVRLPRLYDESGFGIAWPTWKRIELLPDESTDESPAWMTFRGKWGNPRSNCHPLVKLGFNICEFVDGPTGIPTKKAAVQDLKNGIVQVDNPELGCFIACILTRAGIMNDDGTLNEEGFRAQIPADVPEEDIATVLDACQWTEGVDDCDTASRMAECYLSNRDVPLLSW